ncbi:MAG: hypothetical protein M1818_001819 [Claussenomyces sp. TS43310]|nr:MAG: hypothetical protein M1818_001819 [Claussenomyces sp. TS43310]
MSDDEADPELLALLRQALLGHAVPVEEAETRVLESAEYVYNNAIDVAIDSRSTKAAASMIYEQMQKKEYSTKTWSSHDLHPKTKDERTVAFIFVLDLLNFSFWSDKSEEERFAIEYQGKRWTGYWSLVAALQRALDEVVSDGLIFSWLLYSAGSFEAHTGADIPITSSDFWQNEDEFTDDVLMHIFRSATAESMPMLQERMQCLREAGQTLYEKYECSFINCIKEANNSAAALVNILARDFTCFRDEFRFESRRNARFLKRAQILVADLWACFEGQGYGEFHDIDKITMFADYRIPQILSSMGCLMYNPQLDHAVRQKKPIGSGHTWEIQLRGCSIWCVELIRREIQRAHPEAKVNAILIDFFLYDTMKELEQAGNEAIPHHRTRSIWY